MDDLDWSKELEESLIIPGSNGAVFYNCNKINETSYNPVLHQVQKTDSLFSNVFPQWNSRSAHSWEATINGGKTSRTFTLQNNLQNGLILDSGISSFESDSNGGLIEQTKPGISTITCSLESLDCLLSESPSLTDTTASLEDDGISLIFSTMKPRNFTETFSQTSEEHLVNESRSSGSGDDYQHHQPNPNKRKRGSSTDHHHHHIGITKQQNLDFLQSNYSATTDHHRHRHQSSSTFQINNNRPISSSNINFQQPSSSGSSADEPDAEAIAQMKEIIYRAAAFRPVNLGLEAVEKPKRKNVRISNDPQTVAARQRRERISERIRVLQKLVPGGSKMDTASMLDEAANYLKFLRSQVKALEALGNKIDPTVNNFTVNPFSPLINYSFAMQQVPQFSIHNPNQSKS